LQFLLEQPHAVHVLAQAAAGLRGTAGLAPHHQRAAQSFFQRPYALRYRRRRDEQRGGGAFEAALAHDGSQGRECGVVEHGSFCLQHH